MKAVDYLNLTSTLLNSQKEITLGGSIARQIVTENLNECRDIDFFYSNNSAKRAFHNKLVNLRNFRIESLGGRGYNSRMTLNNYNFTLINSEWYLLHENDTTYIINYMKLSNVDSVEFYSYDDYQIPVQFGSECLGTKEMWDNFMNKPKSVI